eukprot:TRINITY_DN8278_c0_g1_i1.p1 TRINITY_DN8278_c0_g1~~TRINITY_DN8278_c0_g1_i1.p1  ORF type:complete len:277 (+),score=53.28 TRINITY_DN8278_c0_g1_i1:61-891(+)
MVYLKRTAEGKAQYGLAGTSAWMNVNHPGQSGRQKSMTAPIVDRSLAKATTLDCSYVDQLQNGSRRPSLANTNSGRISTPGSVEHRPRMQDTPSKDPQDIRIGSQLVDLPPLPAEKKTMCTSSEDLRDIVLQQAFMAADKDGNGTLSKAEFSLMLRRTLPNIPARVLQQAWNMADANMDMTVSYQEFLMWIKKDSAKELANALTEATGTHGTAMCSIFRLWDTNESGTISFEDLHQLMLKVCPKMDDEELRSLFHAMDVNHDGQIDYREFAQFIFA